MHLRCIAAHIEAACRGKMPSSNAHLLAVVGVWSIEELNAGEGTCELAAARDPRNGGALVKKEAGVEELDALLLNEAHSQYLALLLIRDELGWQHLHAH